MQALRRKEREYEHEMERLAREKITAQQRLGLLKKELSATWEHIDFSTLLPEHISMVEPSAAKNGKSYLGVYTFPRLPLVGLDWAEKSKFWET